MKNYHLIFVVSLLMTGCASFQPSTYYNRSTQNGNVITATGNAATAAASANRSYNCPSCVTNMSGQGASAGGYGNAGPYAAPGKNHIDTIADSAANTLTNAISSSINTKIYEALSGQ